MSPYIFRCPMEGAFIPSVEHALVRLSDSQSQEYRTRQFCIELTTFFSSEKIRRKLHLVKDIDKPRIVKTAD